MKKQNGKIINKIEEENDKKKLKKLNKERTQCEIFTRVMGYHRPVSYFNHWKKSEFYDRKYFVENKSQNSEFIKKYSS